MRLKDIELLARLPFQEALKRVVLNYTRTLSYEERSVLARLIAHKNDVDLAVRIAKRVANGSWKVATVDSVYGFMNEVSIHLQDTCPEIVYEVTLIQDAIENSREM